MAAALGSAFESAARNNRPMALAAVLGVLVHQPSPPRARMHRTQRRAVPCALALSVTLTLGAAAQGGTLVVTNKGAHTASVIDVASGRTRAELPTGQGPHEVAMASNGRWAVATNYGAGSGGNSLTLIDVVEAEVIRTISLGRYTRPHGAMFLEGDSLLAVTSESTNNVVLVRIPSGEIAGAVGTDQGGSHMVTPVTAQGRAFTSNIQPGTISELDLHAQRLVRVLDVAPQVEAITITPDGREVWVGSNARGTVIAVDAASGDIEVVAEGFGWPYRILITPDNGTAIIPDLRNHELRILERATRREVARLEFPGGGPQGVALNDDATTLYLSLSAQRRIAVIDMDTRAVTGYIQAGDRPDGIGFSSLTAR